MKKILVIQLRQIGDVVLSTPIPRLLKKHLPGARVCFLTEAPSHKLLEGNPHIDELLLNDRKGSFWDTLKLWRTLRAEKFDAIVDCMGNPRSAQMSFVSGAPMRISYANKSRDFLYTHALTPPALPLFRGHEEGSFGAPRHKG